VHISLYAYAALNVHLQPFLINGWGFLKVSCINLNRGLHIWCESDEAWEFEHCTVLWQQATRSLAFVRRQLPISLT